MFCCLGRESFSNKEQAQRKTKLLTYICPNDFTSPSFSHLKVFLCASKQLFSSSHIHTNTHLCLCKQPMKGSQAAICSPGSPCTWPSACFDSAHNNAVCCPCPQNVLCAVVFININIWPTSVFALFRVTDVVLCKKGNFFFFFNA